MMGRGTEEKKIFRSEGGREDFWSVPYMFVIPGLFGETVDKSTNSVYKQSNFGLS